MASKEMQQKDESLVSDSQAAQQQELCSKMVVVNDMCYYVDIKYGNVELILTFIEAGASGRKRRVSIGFSHIQKIIEILHAVISFNAESLLSSVKLDADVVEDKSTTTSTNPSIIKTWIISVFRNKRFFFDLKKDPSEARFLKIGTSVRGRKININFSLEAIPQIIEILESYSDKFTPVAAKFQASVKKAEETEGTTSPPVGRSGGDQPPKKARKPRPSSTKTDGSPAFVVVPTPEPAKVKFNKKEYKMEVVKTDTNTFVRVTEYIGFRRKSALHIPMTGHKEWLQAFTQFVGDIPADTL